MTDFHPLLVDDKDGRALYLIKVENANGFSADFEVHEVTAWEESNAVFDQELAFRGYLKWDGCMNMETDPDVMAHFCDAEGVANFALALQATYAAVQQFIPNFDHGLVQ